MCNNGVVSADQYSAVLAKSAANSDYYKIIVETSFLHYWLIVWSIEPVKHTDNRLLQPKPMSND